MSRKRDYTMIRVLLGSALPILGLALAVGYTGSDLVIGERGAPMIVAASDNVDLATARFDGGNVCASTLLYGKAGSSDQPARIRFVAMSLAPDGQDVVLGMREVLAPAGSPSETVLLLFDRSGQLVSMSKPAELQPAATAHGDCVTAPKPRTQKPV
jgi:hypothetical protein